MRILFVVPYVPSLIRVRPFNLIRRLHARGHHVTVATIWENAQEQEDLKVLSQYCSAIEAVSLPRWKSLANCVQALVTGEPLQTRYSWSAELMNRIEHLRNSADVVHIEHLRGARYGLDRPSLAEALPVVWDSVDCISDLFEQSVRNRRDRIGRWINRVELSRTRAYEGQAVAEFERVLVTSPNDKASLERLWAEASGRSAGPARSMRPGDTGPAITVVPNGVDLEYFAPGQEVREPDTLVFSGKLSYHANETTVRHLLTDIMPRIWVARPGVRLVLVGKDPSSELRRLVGNWPATVSLTGTVPDVRPFLRRAAVAVAPLVYGVGCQNKVLEAMACATPVVSSSRAVGALAARPGRDVVVADEAEPFAQAVLALLDDQERRRAIGRAGRAYVESHHQWDLIAARLESIYAEMIAARGPRHLERAAG